MICALLVSGVFSSTFASNASALTLGLGWSGDYGQTASEMDVLGHSGASVVRVPIDMNLTSGGTSWGTYDPIFKNAWEHSITIEPVLVRTSGGFTRFPSLQESTVRSEWYVWVKKAVKRYGYNGSFWSGKANPKPATAWEVWNEPNLPDNNPILSASGCQKIGQTFYQDHNTCVQPEEYGAFLVYTAAAIQSGQQEASGGGTEVIYGGLAYPYGEAGGTFLQKSYNVPGVSSSYNGLSIHPYGFDFAHSNGDKNTGEVQSEISAIRSTLNGLPGGSSLTLWITELGWPLNDFGDTLFPKVKDEGEQARLLHESVDWIKAEASSKGIQTLLWYNTRDLAVNTWAYTCGLRDQAGHFRQGWYAFQEEAEAPEWPSHHQPKPTSVIDANGLAHVYY